MIQILRWKLDLSDQWQMLMLPVGSKAIHFGYKEDTQSFNVWTESESYAPMSATHFIILPTGADVPGFAKHVGSCIVNSRTTTVWHCYQLL